MTMPEEEIRCFFEVDRSGSISTPFQDFDSKVEPLLKAEYDHAMLINVNDPLYESPCLHTERTGEVLKSTRFDVPTSVENPARQFFWEITNLGFRLARLEVQETDTGVVVYSRKDWIADICWLASTRSDATTSSFRDAVSRPRRRRSARPIKPWGWVGSRRRRGRRREVGLGPHGQRRRRPGLCPLRPG